MCSMMVWPIQIGTHHLKHQSEITSAQLFIDASVSYTLKEDARAAGYTFADPDKVMITSISTDQPIVLPTPPFAATKLFDLDLSPGKVTLTLRMRNVAENLAPWDAHMSFAFCPPPSNSPHPPSLIIVDPQIGNGGPVQGG